MTHGFQDGVNDIVRQIGRADVFRSGQIIQESVTVREMFYNVDCTDPRRYSSGFCFVLPGDGEGLREAFLYFAARGLIPLGDGPFLNNREAFIGQNVNLPGESMVHPFRQKNGQLVDGGRT